MLNNSNCATFLFKNFLHLTNLCFNKAVLQSQKRQLSHTHKAQRATFGPLNIDHDPWVQQMIIDLAVAEKQKQNQNRSRRWEKYRF